MKIDVEGYECLALDGMGAMGQAVNIVQTEVTMPWPTDAQQASRCDPSKLVALLRGWGMTIHLEHAKGTIITAGQDAAWEAGMTAGQQQEVWAMRHSSQ
jgi:hypothetical protein